MFSVFPIFASCFVCRRGVAWSQLIKVMPINLSVYWMLFIFGLALKTFGILWLFIKFRINWAWDFQIKNHALQNYWGWFSREKLRITRSESCNSCKKESVCGKQIQFEHNKDNIYVQQVKLWLACDFRITFLEKYNIPIINPFLANALILYPLERPGNLFFFGLFWG